MFKRAYCKTTTFQASFFTRIVKPWNAICKLATSDIACERQTFLSGDERRETSAIRWLLPTNSPV